MYFNFSEKSNSSFDVSKISLIPLYDSKMEYLYLFVIKNFIFNYGLKEKLLQNGFIASEIPFTFNIL